MKELCTGVNCVEVTCCDFDDAPEVSRRQKLLAVVELRQGSKENFPPRGGTELHSGYRALSLYHSKPLNLLI